MRKKTYTCKTCGRKYQGYRRSGTCSVNCGFISSLRTIRALKKREGPIYEKWRHQMALSRL